MDSVFRTEPDISQNQMVSASITSQPRPRPRASLPTSPVMPASALQTPTSCRRKPQRKALGALQPQHCLPLALHLRGPQTPPAPTVCQAVSSLQASAFARPPTRRAFPGFPDPAPGAR